MTFFFVFFFHCHSMASPLKNAVKEENVAAVKAALAAGDDVNALEIHVCVIANVFEEMAVV